ncbi:HAD family phosphatase, partial [Mesorhizobium sp. M4A.F.Ca.ET.020.02.1.1]
ALHLPLSACVFVDDQKRNVDGAIAAGMPTVHFDVARPARSYAEALAHFGLTLS